MNVSRTVTVVTDIPRPHALGPVQEVGWMGCRGAPWGGPWHRGACCVAARGLASHRAGISSGQEWPGPGTGLCSHVPAWRAAAHFHLFSGPPRTDRSLVSGGWGGRQGSARRPRSGVRGRGEVLAAPPGARAARATSLSFCGSLSSCVHVPGEGRADQPPAVPFAKDAAQPGAFLWVPRAASRQTHRPAARGAASSLGSVDPGSEQH